MSILAPHKGTVPKNFLIKYANFNESVDLKGLN